MSLARCAVLDSGFELTRLRFRCAQCRAPFSEGESMNQPDKHATPPPTVPKPVEPKPVMPKPYDPKHPEPIPPKHDLPK